MRSNAIGGYFELELPTSKALLYPQAIRFQSARAAFLALLRAGEPKRVWMPYYMCGTMLTSLRQANIDVVFYKIDQQFHVADEIRLEDGDWFVYVNYFGIRTKYVASLLADFAPDRVVIDSSQALFSPPHDCLATIYSPRKFLGVPDGGLLVSSLSVDEPSIVDDGSFERSLSLLKRAAFSPEAAYAEHQIAEKTLFEQEPRGMSDLTKRILSSIDYQEVCRIRNQNFAFLHAHLGHFNQLKINSAETNGALCYPLLTERSKLRDFLISKRIFVATYWQDVLKVAAPSSCEAFLANGLIPLPCDQRYGQEEMESIVDMCLAFFREHQG